MPKELEEKLKKEALKKFGSTTSKRARAYIWGTLRGTGWRPGEGSGEHYEKDKK